MFEISFIIIDQKCKNKTELFNDLIYMLDLSDKMEIVVIGDADNSDLISEIAKYEKQWSNNILIVTTDGPNDVDSLKKLGISYSESQFYLFLPPDVDRIVPSLFEQITPSDNSIDPDIHKYIKDKYTYICLCRNHNSFPYDAAYEMPLLADYRNNAGSIDYHYFYQDIYVANKVLHNGHKHIYDIGSRLDGYISHLLAMDIT